MEAFFKARLAFALTLCGFVSILFGCRSPYYADQGALAGGVTGAGVGAAIGNAHGDTASGAAIGAAVGAVTGAMIGEGLDEVNARNRALIEQQLGRPLEGAATIEDTIAMSQAGLSDEIIINHLRVNGTVRRPTSSDLITLKQQGVSDAVIRAMQQPPPAGVRLPYAAPPPVIVKEHYYGHPCPPPYFHRGPRGPYRPDRWNWGFSFHN